MDLNIPTRSNREEYDMTILVVTLFDFFVPSICYENLRSRIVEPVQQNDVAPHHAETILDIPQG